MIACGRARAGCIPMHQSASWSRLPSLIQSNLLNGYVAFSNGNWTNNWTELLTDKFYCARLVGTSWTNKGIEWTIKRIPRYLALIEIWPELCKPILLNPKQNFANNVAKFTIRSCIPAPFGMSVLRKLGRGVDGRDGIGGGARALGSIG